MKYLPTQILALKKLIRHNTTLIRRSRKARNKNKIIEAQDIYLERTQQFREQSGYINSVIPEAHSRPMRNT